MIRLQNAVNNYITNKGGGKDYQPIDYIVNTEDVITLCNYIDQNGQDDDIGRYITDINKAQEILKVNLNDAVKAGMYYGQFMQKEKDEYGNDMIIYSVAEVMKEDNNIFIHTYEYEVGGIFVNKTMDKIYFIVYM